MHNQGVRGSRSFLVVFVLFLVVGAMAPLAHAVPALQLDIAGGFYDSADETIVTTSNTFTLYALIDPTKISVNQTFYISAALSPKTTSLAGVGSFSFGGADLLTSSVWAYGVPPLEGVLSTFDSGDLAKHGVYPTYFKEFSFRFDPLNTSAVYNTATSPGGIQSGSGLLYAAFQVDKSLLNSAYQLHFDLYSERLRNNGDIDIKNFAPFSHDAGTTQVPEPNAGLLLAVGLIGAAVWQRKSAASFLA